MPVNPFTRPRPEAWGASLEVETKPGGEGGNTLLATALLLSAALVALTTAALH